ncbi:lycopene cyclase domain-containing protein [Paenarthrobacter ureafaciens]|uniref:lycopene cyclase domain-containing protein n=1 Tax=Paenarthrobacter ureafaciens TaxID=37931 RepID=UPI001C2BFB9C|nr:lycopene cyclase domain-containing protein [Paenarthrobacter ureafaciens]
MGVIYLASLLAGIVCMLLLDHRFRLFFWHDAKAATVVTAVGLAFFLAWDIAGIGLGIFLRGESAIATGILLAPELPLEEPVFLLFLILCTMVLYTGAREVLARAADRKRKGGASAAAGSSHGKPARERENA